MKWASICSGIGAPELAWQDVFGAPIFNAEIEPFPSRVLAHRFPGVPNLGDFTKIGTEHGPVDLLVGGTPCQAFSAAGSRRGLDDPRGHLTLEFLALAKRLRARWLVWENVPGALSDDKGKTLGTVLGLVADLGYSFAYRVLDAQYFGLAQRRRRLFLVGYLGGGGAPWSVLIEPAGLRGDSPPSREAPENAPAGTLRATDGGVDPDHVRERHIVPFVPLIASTITAAQEKSGGRTAGNSPGVRNVVGYGNNRTSGPVDVAGGIRAKGGTGHGDFESETFIAFSSKDYGADAQRDIAPTLRSMNEIDGNGGGQIAVAFKPSHYTRDKDGAPSEVFPQLTAEQDKGDQQAVLASGTGIRRLTPREWERLMGFPDWWTMVPGRPRTIKADEAAYLVATAPPGIWVEPAGQGRFRTNGAADGPRYKAVGNSMAVPVMRWIGARIARMDAILKGER